MISVVVPIYNEEETIVALHSAMRQAMDSTDEEWEVVYVNDGSTFTQLGTSGSAVSGFTRGKRRCRGHHGRRSSGSSVGNSAND
jgi:cellulose synthase/poly-beta-1,6-N-acetylglucosamine synthase-like glycosyltransferase